MAKKWLMFLPPAVFGVLVGVFAAGMYRENPDALPSALIGREVPGFELAQMEGAPLLTPEALREPGLKLVNFWASWCAPCRVEHPFLIEMANEGIKIHGVNYKDQPHQAQSFLKELGSPYTTMGADAAGRMAINWGVYGVPETYLIDGEGRILLRHAGPITRQEYERVVRPAIDKALGANGS
ncbi:DsbE family thiol:disulfide interchange protein [Falsigemmobacter intermedius]|uniref:DsbE family thiol:disulfide interchange protein n=1 Tax=Falsigemmobacter intermedius TaxID=1553448 RepID=UPI003F0807EB